MPGSGRIPKYAVHLIAVFLFPGVDFFGGLRSFIPDSAKLFDSYNSASLLYIAAQPVSYAEPSSCGVIGCPNHSPQTAEPGTETSTHISFTGTL